ncbi:hypothetical protein BC832DRAFT_270944 [Gaertneriomyces semiglobifer]|nr:hypothetical protein BC832DRAFT_270944 [Gaertneriomyces semiglobifer]
MTLSTSPSEASLLSESSTLSSLTEEGERQGRSDSEDASSVYTMETRSRSPSSSTLSSLGWSSDISDVSMARYRSPQRQDGLKFRAAGFGGALTPERRMRARERLRSALGGWKDKDKETKKVESCEKEEEFSERRRSQLGTLQLIASASGWDVRLRELVIREAHTPTDSASMPSTPVRPRSAMFGSESPRTPLTPTRNSGLRRANSVSISMPDLARIPRSPGVNERTPRSGRRAYSYASFPSEPSTPTPMTRPLDSGTPISRRCTYASPGDSDTQKRLSTYSTIATAYEDRLREIVLEVASGALDIAVAAEKRRGSVGARFGEIIGARREMSQNDINEVSKVKPIDGNSSLEAMRATMPDCRETPVASRNSHHTSPLKSKAEFDTIPSPRTPESSPRRRTRSGQTPTRNPSTIALPPAHLPDIPVQPSLCSLLSETTTTSSSRPSSRQSSRTLSSSHLPPPPSSNTCRDSAISFDANLPELKLTPSTPDEYPSGTPDYGHGKHSMNSGVKPFRVKHSQVAPAMKMMATSSSTNEGGRREAVVENSMGWVDFL